MGRSPRVLPPLIPSPSHNKEEKSAGVVIDQMKDDTAQARDNLIRSKVDQASTANRHRRADFKIAVGDRVMLATFHRRRDYMLKDSSRVAKFMPWFDGPYTVLHANPDLSSYTLDIPKGSMKFDTFHISQLREFVPNDPELFPSREHARPGPVLTIDGMAEHMIDCILDERRWGRGKRYLIRWVGYGASDSTLR